MIWVAKNLYFFNCLLDGAHTTVTHHPFFVRSGKSVILLFVVVSIDRTAVLCDGVLCSRGIVKIL